MHRLNVLILVAVISSLLMPLWSQAQCPLGAYNRLTNDFYFSASSDQGAVGDVVAIDVALTITKAHPGLAGFVLIGCHDGAIADLLTQPRYSAYFDQIGSDYHFFPWGGAVGPQRPGGGKGFLLSASLGRTVGEGLPVGQSIPL